MRKFFLVLGVTSLVSCVSYYYYLQYKTLSEYVLNLVGIRLLNLTLDSTTINLRFKITSYSKVEGTVSDIHMDLYINDEFVGTAYQNQPMVIPQMGYNYININMKIQNKSFLKNVFEIGKSNSTEGINIRIEGSTKIKSGMIGISVPVKENYKTTLADLLKGV